MPKLETNTIAYYDLHASAFEAQTGGLDLSAVYDKYLSRVRSGGRILDVGCGTGRDTLAFTERGYRVVAFDASREMVKLARERVGNRAEINQLRFEDIAYQEEFDGIWACASLLHVPSDSFPSLAVRFANALRVGGVWYMSFKLGQGDRSIDGRLFVDHTEKTLKNALAEVPVTIVETWVSDDFRPGRNSERWLNAVTVRTNSKQV